MKEVVDQLRALYKINMRLLNIVNAPETDKGPPDEKEKDITRKLSDWH